MSIFSHSNLFPLILLMISAVPSFGQANEKKGIDWTPYMERMKIMIKRHWSPPKSLKASRTVLSFEVDSSGQVHAIRVLNSSGDPAKDVAAMEAIKSVVPFEALPAGGPQRVAVEFTFDFDPKLGLNSKATYKPVQEKPF